LANASKLAQDNGPDELSYSRDHAMSREKQLSVKGCRFMPTN
jgi:hypothetical protein